ncbi:MAG: outer membrane protein assembly factor BamC [Gammaproteobacteria bacterium]|nr:outer membrane protein assembly factor BamC [Gammaproteobacteria bacterium]
MSRIPASCILALATAALALGGCSSVTRGFDRVFPDRRTEYQKAESLPDLEIPPELDNSRIQERMAIPAANEAPNATFRERADARTGVTPPAVPTPATAPPVPATAPAAVPEPTARVQLVSSGAGKVYIVLREPYAAAWRSVGEALEATGVEIDKSNQKRGIYKVYVTDAERRQGMLSKLAFWREEGTPYWVSVTEANGATEIVILDEDDDWDTSAEAGRLVTALYHQMNPASSR